jgi:hypothetical protein
MPRVQQYRLDRLKYLVRNVAASALRIHHLSRRAARFINAPGSPSRDPGRKRQKHIRLGVRGNLGKNVADVCFWHLTDIEGLPVNVRFRGE